MAIRISESFFKFFVGIRISECFLDFSMGIRISKCFFFTFKGIRISECFLEFFYRDQNFLIPASAFFLGGGGRNYESYNKKVPKELCRSSSLFYEIPKKPCLNLENFADFPFYSLQIAYIFRNSKIVQYVLAILLRICPNRNATY